MGWTHQLLFLSGVSTQAARPDRLKMFEANGAGRIIRQDGLSNVFYIPLPTPTLVDYVVAELAHVYYRGEVNDSATVTRVWVMVGPKGEEIVDRSLDIKGRTFREGEDFTGRRVQLFSAVTLGLKVDFTSGGRLTLVEAGIQVRTWR